MPASVFGGYAGAGLESEYKTAVIVAVMAAIANALGLLGYVFALGITAHKVCRLQQGSTLELGAYRPVDVRSCFFRLVGFLAFALLLAYASISLIVGVNLQLALVAPFLLACAVLYLSIPTLQRYVRSNQDPESTHSRSIDFLLIVQAVLASLAIGFFFKSIGRHDAHIAGLLAKPIWPLILVVPIALASTLPYAWSMIGLSVNTARPLQESENE